MASLPLDVRPANPVHVSAAAISADAPATINDSFRPWTEDRRARKLLASIAARPPAVVVRRDRYARTSNTHYTYIGYSAGLQVIRQEHGQRALDAYRADPAGSDAAFTAWCYQHPNTTRAIDAALGSC